MRVIAVVLALMFVSAPAFAGKLAGVTMADKATVGGEALVLNGMGLREKYTFDVYVGGLYLKAKTKDANSVINQNASKRIVMHFVRDLEKAKLADTIDASLKAQGISAAKRNKLKGWMRNVVDGDEIILDYVPGTGVIFHDKPKGGSAKKMGQIEGIEFMKALFSVFVGPNPADGDLKKGLLGQ